MTPTQLFSSYTEAQERYSAEKMKTRQHEIVLEQVRGVDRVCLASAVSNILYHWWRDQRLMCQTVNPLALNLKAGWRCLLALALSLLCVSAPADMVTAAAPRLS